MRRIFACILSVFLGCSTNIHAQENEGNQKKRGVSPNARRALALRLSLCEAEGAQKWGEGTTKSQEQNQENAPPTETLPQADRSWNLSDDGVFTLKDGTKLRLAYLLWPDVNEKQRRSLLVETLNEALEGQIISYKAILPPDRWGIIPAALFIQEKHGHFAPFWLQSGLAQAGFLPLWPEGKIGECWQLLQRNEVEAIKAHRGYWAPRAQAARMRALKASGEKSWGRRFVVLWRVISVKSWRKLYFLRFFYGFYTAPRLLINEKQAKQSMQRQQTLSQMEGEKLILRLILPAGGLTRLRIDSIDHIHILRE